MSEAGAAGDLAGRPVGADRSPRYCAPEGRPATWAGMRCHYAPDLDEPVGCCDAPSSAASWRWLGLSFGLVLLALVLR